MKEVSSPKVSVVVPVFNGIFFIKRFIKSILETNYPNFEVLFVDDGSTDGTTEYLQKQKEMDSRIKVIQALNHFGLTRSRNIGIGCASGEYIAFAEVDMEFDTNWLKEAIHVLEKDRSMGAVTGKVLDLVDRTMIQTVGIKLLPQTSWVICIGFGQPSSAYVSSEEVSMGAVGSVVRKSVLLMIKGYDEQLIRNVEDVDLGWRIWVSGHKIISVPESITYHVTKKDWGIRKSSVSRLKQDIALSQITRLLLKNYEARNVVRYFPQAVAILFARAVINLFKGNPHSMLSFIYVMFWTVFTLPSTLAERRHLAAIRKTSDDEIFKKIMVQSNLFELYFRTMKDVYRKMEKFPLLVNEK